MLTWWLAWSPSLKRDCDTRPFNPLLSALLRMLLVKEPLDAPDSRIGQFERIAMAEARDKRQGGESLLVRLCELMFLEAVRRYLDAISGEHRSWLAALRDRYVGNALSLMHAQPAYPWTLDELGRNIGLSRSVLTERVAQFVGIPPMHYLVAYAACRAASL